MSTSSSVLPRIDAFDKEDLPCTLSKADFRSMGTAPSLQYSPLNSNWTFAEVCLSQGPILLRNAVCHEGEVFEVLSISHQALKNCPMSAVWISRNVAGLGEDCLFGCFGLQITAFEGDSHLCAIGAHAFEGCLSLLSITVPSSVGLLGKFCFASCASLQSVMFEPPSRLTTIEYGTFAICQSLHRLFLPASLTAIDARVLARSGIGSIGIDDGSVSFKVVNEFLVDFGVRSLIWVIGSPDSIRIPSSIEELRPSSCQWKARLRTVEFESDSSLRFIRQSAFAHCESLESIYIPSSVEILCGYCFWSCSSLEAVRFCPESNLRVIERKAFQSCPSLKLVRLPASVEVVGRYRRSPV
jgi:hypothetical protein